jgi:hypothetical protein
LSADAVAYAERLSWTPWKTCPIETYKLTGSAPEPVPTDLSDEAFTVTVPPVCAGVGVVVVGAEGELDEPPPPHPPPSATRSAEPMMSNGFIRPPFREIIGA